MTSEDVTLLPLGVILQLGADRVLFAVDYPFEKTADAVMWFDRVSNQ